jgi:O-antigen/teichoic acid export membrane protein
VTGKADSPHIVARIGAFGLSVALSLAVGFITIPILTAAIGAQDWAILALVQVISTLCGVFVSFGWTVTGPTELAAMPSSQRSSYFARTLWIRAALFTVIAPVTILVSGIVTARWEGFILLSALAYLLPTLGANWFFVGSGQGRKLFLLDSLPQQIGAVVGALLTNLTHDPLTFAGTVSLAGVISVIASAYSVLHGSGRTPHPAKREVKAILRHQTHGAMTALTASGYVSLPIIVVQLIAPGGLPQYTMVDRFFRYGVTALAPVVQGLQSWVPEAGAVHVKRRLRLALWLSAFVALLGAAGIFLLGQPLAAFLSHGTVEIPSLLLASIAVAFASVAVSQVVGLVGLVAFGRSRLLATSTVIGALVGVPLIVLLAFAYGAQGVGIGLAVSELAVTAYQLLVLARVLRHDQVGAPDEAVG